jgi:putative polyhydroxyalkanoate system protein
LRIKRQHDLGVDEAKRRVDVVAGKLSSDYALRSDWRGNTLGFSGSGVNGEVDVAQDSIEFKVKLGFALMMMEGPIRRSIEKALDQELN